MEQEHETWGQRGTLPDAFIAIPEEPTFSRRPSSVPARRPPGRAGGLTASELRFVQQNGKRIADSKSRNRER